MKTVIRCQSITDSPLGLGGRTSKHKIRRIKAVVELLIIIKVNSCCSWSENCGLERLFGFSFDEPPLSQLFALINQSSILYLKANFLKLSRLWMSFEWLMSQNLLFRFILRSCLVHHLLSIFCLVQIIYQLQKLFFLVHLLLQSMCQNLFFLL